MVFTGRRAAFAACLSLALLITSALASAAPALGANANAEAAPLKAVIIVGPAGSPTSSFISDAEAVAVMLEGYGVDVRRIYHPNATWERVLANIQGANLVYYAGHGYGWPNPYTTKLTESRQNGVGLNTYAGSGVNDHTYYGATLIKESWQLAPNAIVFLNHLCYSAGNGEPGWAIPSWDVAKERADGHSNGFIAAGARAVFAYPWQRFNRTVTELFTTDSTMEQIFQLVGPKQNAYFGWIGHDPRKFDSVRSPGMKLFMDPDPQNGFLRAFVGDLNMTASEWAQGSGGGGQVPNLTKFTAKAPGTPGFAEPETTVFTPDGDGVTDSVALDFQVDGEAFVDFSVRDGSGGVVRSLSAWSPGGGGNTSWDGRSSGGERVADGRYTVTATPRNRQGTTGDSRSVDVKVLTTMSSPGASPKVIHVSDGDGLGASTTLSVTLDEVATFWWKMADAQGNVVRTFVNGEATDPGTVTKQWDGRDATGAFVPDGMYYSVTTTATDAGMNSLAVPVEVGAFRVTSAVAPPFVRGGKTKIFISSAEPLMGKPKVKVYAPGLAVKSVTSYVQTGGGWYATIKFPLTAQPGTLQVMIMGTDTGGQKQQTSFFYELK